MTDPGEAARRKQIILGLIMGLVMGVIISALTTFWWWLPAGLVLGFVSGVLIKPPQE